MDKYLIVADSMGRKQPAIHRGIELAKRSGAAVHIVAFAYDAYVAEQEDPETVKELQQTVMDARYQQIEKIVGRLGVEKVKPTIETIWEKRISPWLIEQAKTDEYSMMIKTGHRSETFIYTPSDWQIFRESSIPVMIVADNKWRQKNNILCAIDLGSKKNYQKQLNRKLIEQGKALAEMLNGKLFCCYAIPVPTVLVDLDMVDSKKIKKIRAEKAHAAFASLAEEFGLDKSTLQIKPGRAEKVIPSIADKLKARMVVVGTVGRKGIKGKLIGNTAEQVIHYLRTDLLTLKP